MALSIVQLESGYYPFTDKGQPIADGSLYVGVVGKDPEVAGNQIAVKALQQDGTTVSIAQPISLSPGGVPSLNGSNVVLMADGDYAIKVLDKGDSQVYYHPRRALGAPIDITDSVRVFATVAIAQAQTYTLGQVVYTIENTAGNGGGAVYVVESLDSPDGFGDHATDDGNFQLSINFSGPANVKQFGAAGNGFTDDQPACQGTISYVTSNEAGGAVYFPAGNFVFKRPLGYDAGFNDTSLNLEIYGSGPGTVITQDYESATDESGLMEFKADEITGINLRRIHVHHIRFNANNHRGSAIFGRVLTACQFDHLWTGGNANDILATQASVYLKNCAQVLVDCCVLNHNPNAGGVNGGPAIRLHSTNYGVGLDSFRSKNTITDNIIGEQVRVGIEIESEVGAADGGNVVTDNTIFSTFSNGVNLINTDNNIVSDNLIDTISRAAGAVGVFLDSSSFNKIDNNIFVNAGVNFVKLEGQSAAPEDCVANKITNNIMKTTESALSSAVNLSNASCVANEIEDNVFTGDFAGGTISNLGTSTKINNQFGYAVASSLDGSGVAGALDTTPSVNGISRIDLLASTEYTTFDDGIEQQILFVRGAMGATLVNGASLRLSGSSDFALVDSNSTMLFLFFDSAWWEVSRNFGTSQNRATAIPVSGQYNLGAVLWNSSPIAGGQTGWICTVAGSPGTWKTFGEIQA